MGAVDQAITFTRRHLPFVQVSSALVLGWAAGWLAPLEGTWIAHAAWETSTRKVGVLFGAGISIALFALIRNERRGKQKAALSFVLAVLVLSLCCCIYYARSIDWIPDRGDVIVARNTWQIWYFVLCASFIILLTASWALLAKSR